MNVNNKSNHNSEDESYLDWADNQIKQSRFTGCGRQSFLWAVGTGCAMALHRWRMGSRFNFIKNSFFGTVTFLAGTGYYLCTSERIWKEKNIESTMKVADIRNASEVDGNEQQSPFLGIAESDDDVVKVKEIVLYEKGDETRRKSA